MKNSWDWKRVGLGAVGLTLFVFLLLVGPSPNDVGGNWAIGMLAAALSIFAGIVVAVVTMLGDPRILYSGNWRVELVSIADKSNVL